MNKQGRFKPALFAGIYFLTCYALRYYFMFLIVGQAWIINLISSRDAAGFLQSKQNDYAYNIFLTGLIDIVTLVGFGLWYYLIRKYKDRSPVSYDKALAAKPLFTVIGLGAAANVATAVILFIEAVIAPKAIEEYSKQMEGLSIDNVQPVLLLIIVCFIGPIGEELILRAMIFRALRKGFSFPVSMIVCGVLFGIYHEQPVQGVYTALFGMVLCYLYEKTNSILPCIVMHISYNSFNYIYSNAVELIPGPEELRTVLNLGMAVFSMVIVVLLLVTYSRYDLKPEIIDDEYNDNYDNHI